MAVPVTSIGAQQPNPGVSTPRFDPSADTGVYMWVIARAATIPDLGYCRCNRRDCCGLPIIGRRADWPSLASSRLSPLLPRTLFPSTRHFEKRPRSFSSFPRSCESSIFPDLPMYPSNVREVTASQNLRYNFKGCCALEYGLTKVCAPRRNRITRKKASKNSFRPGSRVHSTLQSCSKPLALFIIGNCSQQ